MHQPSLPVQHAPAWLSVVWGALARHRLLDARQLAAILALPVAEVVSALEPVVEARLLARLVPSMLGSEAPPAYALTRRSAQLYARETGAPVPRVPNPKRSQVTLLHELMVAEVALVLEGLHVRKLLTLDRWDTARERIGFSQALPAKGTIERVPLVADGYAVVTVGGAKHGLLWECDRSSTALRRLERKFSAYLAWLRDGGPLKRFGVRALRILVTAPTKTRLERLRECAIDASGGPGTGLFWFALERDVTVTNPETLLGPVWSLARPHDTGRNALFPTPDAVPAQAPRTA